MSGSMELSEVPSSEAPSPWAVLRQLIGLDRAPVDAPPAVDDSAPIDADARPVGALGLFRSTAPRRHAELFTSERTGEWIRVACECERGADHWHGQQGG